MLTQMSESKFYDKKSESRPSEESFERVVRDIMRPLKFKGGKAVRVDVEEEVETKPELVPAIQTQSA